MAGFFTTNGRKNMARTIEEIYDEMIAEKESKATLSGLLPVGAGSSFQDLLNDITSLSKVANWRLWIYIHAFGTFVLETLFDRFKADVEILKAQAVYGTETWWIEQMFVFQFGDPLVILDVEGVAVLGYDPVNTTNQIIKAAAITSLGGVSTIKVAKESGGDLVALDTAEISALIGYVDKIQPAGVKVNVISLNADLIKTFAEIYYSALFVESEIITNVEAAIEGYFTAIDFGGVMNINRLIDAVQAVEGVNDIKITDIQAKPVGGSYAVIDREYQTSSGYIKTDPAFPLSTSLTYIAQ